MPQNEHYLGDGVTASHDGYQIKLDAGPNGYVYLDPSVLRALVRYAREQGLLDREG